MKFALFLDSFCHKNQEEICWTCLDHRNGSRLVNNYLAFNLPISLPGYNLKEPILFLEISHIEPLISKELTFLVTLKCMVFPVQEIPYISKLPEMSIL